MWPLYLLIRINQNKYSYARCVRVCACVCVCASVLERPILIIRPIDPVINRSFFYGSIGSFSAIDSRFMSTIESIKMAEIIAHNNWCGGPVFGVECENIITRR